MFEEFVENAPIWVSLSVAVVSGCLFAVLTRMLLDELFCMHRTAEEAETIKAKYSFWERFFMEHIFKETLHEADFARWMAVYHGLGLALVWGELLLTVPAVFMDSVRMLMAGCALLLLAGFYLPALILHFILTDGEQDGEPRFRFEKYHMTDEYDELM